MKESRAPGLPEELAPADLILDGRHLLGECAHWAQEDGALYWTDIEGIRLWKHQPATGRTWDWPMPERLATFALCEDARFILLGLASRLAFFEPATGNILPIVAVEPALKTRINDGKTDRAGNFVFGMQDEAEPPQPIGGFYRLNTSLNLERLPLPAAAVSNGIAFSPDGARMYYCDTPTQTLRCADYTPDSLPRNDRIFADTTSAPGSPDGATVDAEGGLWNARFGGGCLIRYAADGQATHRLPLPTSRPTCPVFGGAALDTLYITSARTGLEAAQLAGDPHAGGIFSSLPGIRGLSDTPFRGAPK